MVLEVSGEAKMEEQAKVQTAEQLWTEAVNNWGGLGRWGFIEISDPWDAESLIREKWLRSAATIEPRRRQAVVDSAV